MRCDMANIEYVLSEMANKHGNDFSQEISKYGDIYNLWYKGNRPDMMRDILWFIDHRQNYYTYYEELAAFGKWLHEMRQVAEPELNSFEDWLAANESKFRKEIEEGALKQ